ncbi:hypothetical protein ASC94_28710 [Massilia sp. Root418]|uniref:hypothetical protein n=1 Tax=Massilia sp. Root418 TaxID=1736532 RepID=UPI0006FD19AC|nr:hypothetical protein [Massilia sp. Root418]KQW87367.1 hypothetical protein ASC94_28710 [Massilia sp. Root418]
MTIYLNTSVLGTQISEVAVAGAPFSAGVPVFRRLDGKIVPLSGTLNIAQASQQNILGGTAALSNAVLKTTPVPNSSLGTTSNEYGDKMVEAGGMLFMVYKTTTPELRTCWASKDGITEVDMSLATGNCDVSDIVTDGTNIAVIASVASQMKIFFFNANLRSNGSNGQVLTPVVVAGATAGPGSWNHVFDAVGGNLYYSWLTGLTLYAARINLVTGASLSAVTVSSGVAALYVHPVSRTRAFDMERFGTGQIAFVYKMSATSDINFAVVDANLVAVGAPRSATAASIGSLSNCPTRRISVLGEDKICWGVQSTTKASLFVLTNASVLTSILSTATTSNRSAVMGRLSDGRVAFAFANDAAAMDLTIVRTDGTLMRRGVTVVTGVGNYGSHLIAPLGDRFLMLAAGDSIAGYGGIFLNDGTPASLTRLTIAGKANDAPGQGWAAQKANASGTATVIHGAFRWQTEDAEGSIYNYYNSLLVCINATGTENFRQFLNADSQAMRNCPVSLVSDGMQLLTFGQNTSGTRNLTRFVFEQCVFAGIAGSYCPNEGDLSNIFSKGTYRINHPNVVFNYNTATPIAGAKGNVSSGVLTLN